MRAGYPPRRPSRVRMRCPARSSVTEGQSLKMPCARAAAGCSGRRERRHGLALRARRSNRRCAPSGSTRTAYAADRRSSNPSPALSGISPIGEMPGSQLVTELLYIQRLVLASRLLSSAASSMLKIQRTANGDVVFTVSGRLAAHNVGELSALLAAEQDGRTRVLDLRDLVLADSDAIGFLSTCEADSIVLRNCPPYIRAWMSREGAQP